MYVSCERRYCDPYERLATPNHTSRAPSKICTEYNFLWQMATDNGIKTCCMQNHETLRVLWTIDKLHVKHQQNRGTSNISCLVRKCTWENAHQQHERVLRHWGKKACYGPTDVLSINKRFMEQKQIGFNAKETMNIICE